MNARTRAYIARNVANARIARRKARSFESIGQDVLGNAWRVRAAQILADCRATVALFSTRSVRRLSWPEQAARHGARVSAIFK